LFSHDLFISVVSKAVPHLLDHCTVLIPVYQKVCPPPVFALFLEIVELSGALPGAGGGGGGQGPIPIPSGPGASVADIDDGSSSANGSGGDWDKVSQ